jgi:hypothetical protein
MIQSLRDCHALAQAGGVVDRRPALRRGGLCPAKRRRRAGAIPCPPAWRARRWASGSRRPARATGRVRRSRIERSIRRSTRGTGRPPARRPRESPGRWPPGPRRAASRPCQASSQQSRPARRRRPAGPPLSIESATGPGRPRPEWWRPARLFRQLAQTRGHVAADFHDFEIRPQGQQLRLAPRAAGGHRQPLGNWASFRPGASGACK